MESIDHERLAGSFCGPAEVKNSTPYMPSAFLKTLSKVRKKLLQIWVGEETPATKEEEKTKGQIAQCKKWSSYNRKRRKSHCCHCPGVVLQWKQRAGLRGGHTENRPSQCLSSASNGLFDVGVHPVAGLPVWV